MYHDLERFLTWISTLGFILPIIAFYFMRGARSESIATVTLKLFMGIIIIASVCLFSWLNGANAIRFS